MDTAGKGGQMVQGMADYSAPTQRAPRHRWQKTTTPARTDAMLGLFCHSNTQVAMAFAV